MPGHFFSPIRALDLPVSISIDCMAAWPRGCMAAWLHDCMTEWLHGCMAA